jgi:hypothetical protein
MGLTFAWFLLPHSLQSGADPHSTRHPVLASHWLDLQLNHPISSSSASSERHNFDIFWLNPHEIKTTFQGYGTTLRLGTWTVDAIQLGPVIERWITLQTELLALTPYSILLTFRLNNSNPIAMQCDVAVWADTIVDVNEDHTIGALSGGSGLFWSASEYRMNVLARHYPLVSDVSTYWFGHLWFLMENIWNGTDAILVTNESDVAMAFSWQNISVPGYGTTTRSAIFRSGEEAGSPPTIQATGPSSISLTGLFTAQFSLSDPNATARINIFARANGVVSRVAENLSIGAHSIPMTLLPFDISVGPIVLSFFAVNELGFVSTPSNISATVGPDPTMTERQSPTMTQSPAASQTPNPYPSPYPTSHAIRCSWTLSQGCFDIQWRYDMSYIASTDSKGYVATLRCGNETTPVFRDEPADAGPVRLVADIVVLSEFSFLLMFKLTANVTATCDVAVCASTLVGSNNRLSFARLPGDQGLLWGGADSETVFTMSVIGRRYPLVSNV